MLHPKTRSSKKYEVRGHSIHNPNQFTAFQNLFYNFLKLILNVNFPPRSSVFEAHFQEPSTIENQDLQ